jgi:hypothetical protein
MNRAVFTLILCIASSLTHAQSTLEVPIQNISTDSNVVYRLFATRNMYNFIKLNTRNGQLWQVQWGTESKFQYQSTLSDIPLVDKNDEANGRFFLYPTPNRYNFMLLDQVNGRVWLVQWSLEEKERMVSRIY